MSKKKQVNRIQFALAIIFAVILVFSLVRVMSQIPEYTSGRESIERALEVAKGGEKTPGNDVSKIDPDTAPMPAEQEPCTDAALEFMSSIDIENLQSENPDVIGWILIPGTDISYPLLKAENNEYYLHHTWDKQKNSCGSIFYDYRSSPGDWNSVIYGHNMRNGSMFADLHQYKKSDFSEDNDRLLILHDGDVKEYRFAAAFEAQLNGVPYVFNNASREEKVAFKNDLSEKSGKKFSTDTSFVSLSTCTGLGHKTRWVVVFFAKPQNDLSAANPVYLTEKE